MAHIDAAHLGSASGQTNNDQPNLFNRIVSGVAHFFVSLDNALLATHEYERLSRLSEKQLVARGLSRSELTKVIFERHFETPSVR